MQNQDSKTVVNQVVKTLRPPEVAGILGVTVGTLAKWRCANTQPLLRWVKVGRAVRYRVEAVQAYLAARESSGDMVPA